MVLEGGKKAVVKGRIGRIVGAPSFLSQGCYSTPQKFLPGSWNWMFWAAPQREHSKLCGHCFPKAEMRSQMCSYVL